LKFKTGAALCARGISGFPRRRLSRNIFGNAGNALAETEIPDFIRKFIFTYVDSAEMLDVLALVMASGGRRWNASQISQELRANENSIAGRLRRLEQIGLLEKMAGDYVYRPRSPDLAQTAEELVHLYGTMKHRILGLVFSPLRQIQSIANAFIFSKEEGESDD
jgi:hypothetical protein